MAVSLQDGLHCNCCCITISLPWLFRRRSQPRVLSSSRGHCHGEAPRTDLSTCQSSGRNARTSKGPPSQCVGYFQHPNVGRKAPSWSLHCYKADRNRLRAIHFREYVPEASPKWTIPGDVACTTPSTSLPAYMGETFVMFSKFWLMVAEFARPYYQDTQVPFKDRVSLRFAETIYQKLLHWMDTAGARAQQNSAQTHHAAIF